MKKSNIRKFDFSKARRFTEREREQFRRAIERKLGVKVRRRGRPPKGADKKYVPISMKLNPIALARVKAKAKHLGVGYQTVINKVLLQHA